MHTQPPNRSSALTALFQPAVPVLLQVLSILALSSALGFAFNAANPLGVRWHETEAALAKPAVAASLPATPQPAAVPPPSPVVPHSSVVVSTSAPISVPAVPVALGAIPAASNNTATVATNAPFNAPSPTTWAAIKVLMKDSPVVLVDARSRPAYDAGHIPGAVCLPEDSPATDLEAFRTLHGTNAHVVVYCSSTSCSLSFKLAYKLAKDYGFTRTQYMTGGYFEYQRDAGLADSNTPPVTPAVAAPALPAGSAVASGTTMVQVAAPAPGSVYQLNPQPMSWGKVEEWCLQRQALLVDTRSEEAFKAGHVPGAVSLPADSTPERIAAFRQEYDTNRSLIVYGDVAGSMRAFVTGRQLMREAGFSSVRFVMEGYKEWQAQQQQTSLAK
jgi:rhodanese-related sulfurtransferase